jgi:tetratricopeptide (TPR) repeat protein
MTESTALIGKYKIVEEIGRGGFATVYKALAKQPDQRHQNGREFALALSAAAEQAKGEFLKSLYDRAHSLFATGDLDAAEASLRQVLSIQPSHKDALALLERIKRRRESARRYRELVNMVAQARALAVELKRNGPNVADPEGVLRLLTERPHPSPPPQQPARIPSLRWESNGSTAVPSPSAQLFTAGPSRKIAARNKKIAWILLGASGLLFFLGIIVIEPWLTSLGFSAGLGSLVMLLLSDQKPMKIVAWILLAGAALLLFLAFLGGSSISMGSALGAGISGSAMLWLAARKL